MPNLPTQSDKAMLAIAPWLIAQWDSGTGVVRNRDREVIAWKDIVSGIDLVAPKKSAPIRRP